MSAINELLHDRYRIIGQIGHGGMGTVYEAEDRKRFGKSIALKEILISTDEEPDFKQQTLLKQAFEREAKILAGLEHEAFPQVIDYFVEAERQFLVMELVQGENLSKLLEKRRKPFPTAEVLNWTEQLLDALDYLHTLEKPVYHRDIKPQNLKLTSRGRIKLLDFGIAKGADVNIGLTITNQTFIAATLHYSPLEQIIKAIDPNYREFLEQKFGEKITNALASKTDGRSDIYALGATIYHLLTNALPIDSLKRSFEFYSGKSDPLTDPQELNPQIPAMVSKWILKAMQLEMKDRFADAVEMRRSLREIIEIERRNDNEELNREVWNQELEKLKQVRESLEKERLQIEAERRYFMLQKKAAGQNLDENNLKTDETIPDMSINFDGQNFQLLSEAELNIFDANTFVILPAKDKLSAANQKAEIDIKNSTIENQNSFSLTATSYLVGSEFESKKELLRAESKKEELESKAESEDPSDGEKPERNRLLFASAMAVVLIVMFIVGYGMWYFGNIPDTDLSSAEIDLKAVAVITESNPPPSTDFEPQTAYQEKADLPTTENQPVKTIEPKYNKVPNVNPPQKIGPGPSKKQQTKKENQGPCQVITVDCIISDN